MQELAKSITSLSVPSFLYGQDNDRNVVELKNIVVVFDGSHNPVPKTFTIPLKIASQRNTIFLVFKIAEARSPAEMGLGGALENETRKLGIGLRKMTLSYDLEP